MALLAPKPRFAPKPGNNTIFPHKILTSPGYYLLSNKKSVVVCTSNLMHYCVVTGVKVPPYGEIITAAQTPNCSFSDFIDKLKADLAYFKDDFWNNKMFKVIYRPTGNIPHPGTGCGASKPNPLHAPMGGPGSTTLRGNPPPWATPVPFPRTTPAPPPRNTPVPPTRSTSTGSQRKTPVPSS